MIPRSNFFVVSEQFGAIHTTYSLCAENTDLHTYKMYVNNINYSSLYQSNIIMNA